MTRRRSPSTSADAALVAVLVVCAGLLCATRAHALACCGSILAQPERLAPMDDISLSIGFGGGYGLGTFSSGSRFSGAGGMVDADLRGRLGLAVRLSSTLQVSTAASWMQGYRRFGDASSFAGAPGDLAFGLRLEPEAVEDLAFTAALALPTGRTAAEAHDALGADVTGRGAAQLRLGGQYEVQPGAWFVVFGAGVTGIGAERGTGIDPRAALDGFLTIGRDLDRAALALTAQESWEPALEREGVELPRSSRRRTVLSLAGAYPLDAWRTVSCSLAVDPPLGGIATNTEARVVLQFGLRFLNRP